MQQKNDPLYSRGRYKLAWDARTDGSLRSPYLQIVWYDESARRNRSRSTGEAEMHRAEEALDAFYLERERGVAVCPTCRRPLDAAGGHLVTQAISDYLAARAESTSIGSIRPRLSHVIDWLTATKRVDMACDDLDKDVIEDFRKWAKRAPIVWAKKGVKRQRSPSTIEASVRQLAAAINFAHDRRDIAHKARFAPKPPVSVDQTPTYRATVKQLAAMFNYCVRPDRLPNDTDKVYARRIAHRASLLRFLQISVATWCRPDAAHDFSSDPKRKQWNADAHVVLLNPAGRPQTRKHRPAIPVGPRIAALINAAPVGYYVGVGSVRKAMEAMLDALKMPRDRETGQKLIRRSMATIARQRLGEDNEVQWQRMLGHQKASTSDLYALFEPANLGRALAVTDQIIDEIEALAPGAFRACTGTAPELRIISGGLNA